MPDAPEFSCVIPAFNEEACIHDVLVELVSVLSQGTLPYEILVIDNGSADRTGELARSVAAKHKQIQVLRLDANQGYGGAILHGFAASRGNLIGFLSADGEVPPQSILQMVELMRRSKTDLIKARRVHRQDGAFRKVLSVSYQTLVCAMLGIKASDINGYPMFMTRAAYRAIAPTKKDWMINMEILFNAARKKLTLIEIDVEHRKRAAGKSHVWIGTSISMFFKLLRFYFASFFKS